MKNEYAKKIEDTLVDLTRGGEAPKDIAGMKALLEKEVAKPSYGMAAANRHENIDESSAAFDKVMKISSEKKVNEMIQRVTIRAQQEPAPAKGDRKQSVVRNSLMMRVGSIKQPGTSAF